MEVWTIPPTLEKVAQDKNPEDTKSKKDILEKQLLVYNRKPHIVARTSDSYYCYYEAVYSFKCFNFGFVPQVKY